MCAGIGSAHHHSSDKSTTAKPTTTMGICQSIAGGDAVIVVDPPSPSPGKTNFCAECETSANDVEWNKNDVDKTTSSTTAATSVAGDNTTSFRFQTGTCALEYWEPLKLLGEGSISDIHLVRRRPARVKIPYKEECDIMTTAAGKITSQKTTTAKVSESKSDSGDTEQETYALKSIIKDHVRNDAFLEEIRNEIYTMSHLSHPNVVRVVEAYERKRHIYLIMEYCSGGDLCQVEGTGISEAKAAVIIKHILSAVGYLHENRVIHRDRKYTILQSTICSSRRNFASSLFSSNSFLHPLVIRRVPLSQIGKHHVCRRTSPTRANQNY
jgi:serine/threonine protein kinase